MTDPEENKENTKKEHENDTSAEAGSKKNESTNTNWNAHMQIDEEGNEVSPGDQ